MSFDAQYDAIRRPIDTIAADLARAQDALEAAERAFGGAARSESDARCGLATAKERCDLLRLELREAVRAAGAWPDPGRSP